MKLTNQILKSKKSINLEQGFIALAAKIASVFSVIFAMSIVVELKDDVNVFLFILLSVFVLFFLSVNEVIKVKSIKHSSDDFKSLMTLCVTFLLSITLSGIGIYLWVNKTDIITSKSVETKTIESNNIKQKYGKSIDLVLYDKYEESAEYAQFMNDLNYWKSRRAMDKDDVKSIRENIVRIETSIEKNKNKYNELNKTKISELNNKMNSELELIDVRFVNKSNDINKNNFITFILLTLVIVVEFAIIYLNKNDQKHQNEIDSKIDVNIKNKYLFGRRLLETLFLSAEMDLDGNLKTNVNKAKFSLINRLENINWDELVDMYNIYIDLCILDRGENISTGEDKKGVLVNTFKFDKLEDVLKQYDMFFEIVLNK